MMNEASIEQERFNVLSLQLSVGAGGEAEIVFDGDCTDVLVTRRNYDEIKDAITENVLKVRNCCWKCIKC